MDSAATIVRWLTSQIICLIKALSILNLALVSGTVLFGLLISVLILTTNASDNSKGFSGIFNYMVPVFVVIGIIGGNNLFKKTLNQSGENLDLNLNSKMTNYRSALIMKYALFEGPALFAIIAAFVSHQIGLMAYAGLLVLLLLYARPNIKSTIAALKLDQQESLIIEDPEGVIGEMQKTLK